ncbi:MAG: hypothetical protein RLZZ611_310 [Cyanobacteriota bacterium]|jgi:hypothetical protein
MPIDDRTTNRNYKLPNAGNFLADDVQRLRDALAAIDADVFARYTKTETDQKLADLINGAPGALDTLNELAAAMGNDPNFAATITNALAGKPGFADVWTRTQADARYVQGITQTENTFTGTGTQTTFALSQTPPTRESLLVTVDGVVQPVSAYTLSGSALILSEAPVSGASIRVLMLGVAGPVQSAATLNFSQAGTGAVTRTVESKLRDVVSVKDFGAVGDGTTDDSAAIQAAIDAASKGVLYFPPGNYKITSMITITKNGQNDSTQSCLEIQATGAKLVSTVAPALRITQTKRLSIIGLQVDAPVDPSNASVYVTGMWSSTWKECAFGDVAFTTAAGLESFDQVYWCKFEKCQFRQVIINTGTAAARYEFNSNTFEACRIWSGEYGIKKYGSHTIEDVVFVNCDISYQTAGILYIDEACSGTLQFVGGYFDSVAGFPIDLKGLTVDFVGRAWNPNDANVSAFRIADGSRTESKGLGGVRSGSRYPVSSYNLIINGDLRAGTTGVATSNASLAMQSGAGVFGRYVKITSSTAFGTATFVPIALPFDGTYTLTVIGRVNSGATYSNIANGIFNAINLDSTWTVDSFTFNGTQGAQPTFSIQNGASGSFDIDIAYVGLTFGGIGQLYAPIHPTADRFTYPYAPAALSGGKTTSNQAASIATVVVSDQTSVSFMVRAMFVDSSYPQYNATCVYMFSGMTPSTRPTVASLTQLQAHASGLDITAVPVITSSVSGTTITLTASVSPTTSGETFVSYEITNIFNPAGNTITLL